MSAVNTLAAEVAVIVRLPQRPSQRNSARSAHHHNRCHDRNHNHHHDDDHQRALDHVSKQAEPGALRQQIHAALWALSENRLANFRMHGAIIEFPGILVLVHLTSPPNGSSLGTVPFEIRRTCFRISPFVAVVLPASLLLSREMPIHILLRKPRPHHRQRENTGQKRGETQWYVVETDIDERMHIAGYDENPCQ